MLHYPLKTYCTFFVLSLLIAIETYGQVNEFDLVDLTINIVDNDNKTAISDVHIIALNSNTSTYSDQQGMAILKYEKIRGLELVLSQ